MGSNIFRYIICFIYNSKARYSHFTEEVVLYPGLWNWDLNTSLLDGVCGPKAHVLAPVTIVVLSFFMLKIQ